MWQLPLIAVEIAFNWGRNLPTANHRRLARSAAILPQMAAECRGFPWKLQWIDVRGNCRGNCRGVPWQLPLIGGLPWHLLRMAAEFRGNCCGLTSVEYAVATAVEFRGNCRVLEDYRGNCGGWPPNAVVFHGNCGGLTSVEIAVATAVEFRGNCRVLAWHFPWEDCRGNCRGRPWHSPLIAVDCRAN